jgi:hypothetical protein
MGGGQRILTFAFHPLIPDIFATGSFDGVVRVHSLTSDMTLTLKKH